MDDSLLIRTDAGVATIVFNRPEARNALNHDIVERLPRELARLERDGMTRVVVLRGAGGKAFASGGDLREMSAMDSTRAAQNFRHVETMLAAIEGCDLPIVAMIEGYALGGGCEVAATCDLRVATPDARFGIPIARIGHTIDFTNARRLLALIGPAVLKELLLTDRILDAAEALRIGLVNAVLPPEQIEPHTYQLARKLAEKAPLSLRGTKRTIRECLHNPTPQGIEDPFRLAAECFDTEDFKEGVRAFFEKRPPRFAGR
ncbi:MAG TPA: enoyl-CoA hydratase-related protein [Candidatus Methylomirabilis sp.]|nr:enoyl-CoA hydratase-related protein [Candidatus Methylomirabilis sp.]